MVIAGIELRIPPDIYLTLGHKLLKERTGIWLELSEYFLSPLSMLKENLRTENQQGEPQSRQIKKSCQSPGLHKSVKRKDSLVLVIKWLCIFKETLEMAQGSSPESKGNVWGSGGCPGESKDSGTQTARK